MSDYDFVVLLNEKVEKNQYSKCQLKIISELLRVVKTDHLDLAVLNDSKNPLFLKYNIIKEGRVIYEKKQDGRERKEKSGI